MLKKILCSAVSIAIFISILSGCVKFDKDTNAEKSKNNEKSTTSTEIIPESPRSAGSEATSASEALLEAETITEQNESNKDVQINDNNSSQNTTNSFNTTVNNTPNVNLNTTTDNSLSNDHSSYTYQEFTPEITERVIFEQGAQFGEFKYNNKSGFINTNGKVVVEPIYESLSGYSENYALAEKVDNNFVIIDTQGNEVATINYTNAEVDSIQTTFSEGLAFLGVKDNDAGIKSICVDTSGNVVFESNLSVVSSFTNGVAIGTQSDRKSGAYDMVGINTNGQEIWRKAICSFSVSSYIGTYGIKNNIIIYKSPENKLSGAMDINGNTILNCEYEDLTYAGDGRIGFKKYGLWGYLDYSGNVVIQPQYKSAREFKNGQAIVKTNDSYNAIDVNGNIKFCLDSANSNYSPQHFENGLYVVTSTVEQKEKLVDNNGNTIFEISIANNDGFDGSTISYFGGSVFYVYSRINGNHSYTYYHLIENN